MDSINTQPILDIIAKDAQQAFDRLIAEARDRSATISEHANARIEEQLEQTKQEAHQEALVLEDRLRRLSMLETRKALVAGKRGLIDQAFDQALKQLNASPTEQVAALMRSLLLTQAQGDESLQAGSLNDAFCTPAFLAQVNEQLKAQHKLGQLQLEEKRVPGVCGLVVRGKTSEIHLTFEALLSARREELEAHVASLLFPAQAD